eukprot:4127067-Prymnesium_polylepis.1
MSDAVDGRSAARCGNTIVRQNVTFPQIPATLACGTSVQLYRVRPYCGLRAYVCLYCLLLLVRTPGPKRCSVNVKTLIFTPLKFRYYSQSCGH